MGPNLSMSSKTSIYFTKQKTVRSINNLYYNAHTEPLKFDDLYKFELSKCMFDCINGLLPIPLLEYFTTNETTHAHHTRQRNIPHVTLNPFYYSSFACFPSLLPFQSSSLPGSPSPIILPFLSYFLHSSVPYSIPFIF